VELGEIENQLLNYPGINEAVVLAKENKFHEKYLYACIATRKGFDPSALENVLSKGLPDYMIPSSFIRLQSMPLTPSGKIDRKALPGPEIKVGDDYTAPGSEIEKRLTEIWSEILGIEKNLIGINSNFFKLGGHSLKAARLIARIDRELNVKMPLAQIFRTLTIKRLAKFIEDAAKEKFSPIKTAEEKEYYPLSSAQKRLFVLQQMEPGNTGYNMPVTLILEGVLDRTKLEDTFLRLIRRHESLRTSFELIEEEPVQRVHDDVEFEIEYYSAKRTAQSAERKEESYAPCAMRCTSTIKNFIRSFDLAQAPLLRVGLIKSPHTPTALRGHPSKEGKGGKYLLMIDIHHIVSDGTSMGGLVNEFMVLYKGNELSGLRLQYKDYAEWEKSEQEREAARQQQAFWLQEFGIQEDIPVLELPFDYMRPKVQGFEGSTLNFEIDGKNTRALRALALEEGATLFMVLLSLYNIFLSKLSGQEVIVVGTPTEGRPHADLGQVIGMFVNTLPLKNYPVGAKNFKEFLKEVKEKTLEAFENQDYQYEALVNTLVVNRDTSRNPLFDTMFILQNLEIPEMEIPGLTLKPWEYERTTSKFDLTFECIEMDDHLSCIIEYSTTLFAKETIQRFIRYLKQIISFVLVRPDTKLAETDMLPEEEKRQLMVDFNDTEEQYPTDKTIYQLIEDQVDKLPDHVALVGQSAGRKTQSARRKEERRAPCAVRRAITYREMDEKANQLANYLSLKKGIIPNDGVVVLLERSIRLIVCLLGVMKSGGAYVPLDPSLPGERLRVVFNDASIGVVISQRKYFQKLTRLQSDCKGFHTLLCIDDHDLEIEIDKYPAARPGIKGAGNPAYIMYTSGSSGIPKGVLVEHRTIVNTLVWRKNFYEYKPGNVSLQNPPYFFDSSVTDIFTPLLGGARLVLPAEEQKTDLEVLKEAITLNKVSHFIAVPAFYNILVEEIADDLKNVKKITVAGEHFPDKLVRKHFEKLPRVRIFNEYGPTENSVNTTAYELRPDSPRALIGKPISNVAVYILDRSLYLCPIGVTGEMCLAGSSLARGYLNNPELTADKFLTRNNRSYTSYKSYISKRIYRTGDLGRWWSDGNLEFSGRLDTQVKIRGIRVEIGEIENHLLAREEIKEAVALYRNGKYLCAYLVLTGDGQGAAEVGANLKAYLAKKLPEYMIPSYFMVIDSIPFMPSGKIDRDALPAPLVSNRDRTAPGNRVEKRLVEIWSDVLGTKKGIIGIDSNFFDLGGHSLRATVISSRIHKAFGVKIPLAEIFKTPSIRGLAKYIHEARQEKYASIDPVEKKEYYTLSPAQQRLYLLQRMELGNTSYNLPLVVPFPGVAVRKKLESVFKELIRRHESLRTSFEMLDGMPVQRVHDKVEFEIEYHNLDSTQVEDKVEKEFLEGTRGLAPLSIPEPPSSQLAAGDHYSFIRPFDLSRAPLLRVGLVRQQDQHHLLMVDMHHIISDGVSHVILTNEFRRLYTGIKEALPLLRLQYKDYSQWQNSQKQKDLIKEQEAYWLAMFNDEIPVLNLPMNFPRPLMQSFAGCTVEFLLTPKESQTVKSLAKETGATLFMSILAIFTILLSKLSGQEDIIVGTPVGGRRHTDLEPIVGMFVNTLAVRNRPLGAKRLNTFLKEIKEQTLQAYENQEYPFEELVDKIAINRDTGRNPLFDVMFNLMNQEEYTGEIPANQERESDENENKHRKGTAKFDLTLTVIDLGERLFCTFEYCTGLFTAAAIDRFITYFKRILNLLPGNPNQQLADLEIITEAEKKQVLNEFNDTKTKYPHEMTIHRLFEKQVEKTPDNIAAVGPLEMNYRTYMTYTTYISYRELNEKADGLAYKLKEKGVKPGTIVGIKVERSLEMIIGILGILKAGAAYLPIDPAYPQERIDYMLKDSSSKIMVTAPGLFEKLLIVNCQLLMVNENLPKRRRLNNPPKEANSINNYQLTINNLQLEQTNLAYIIYTSGSTGKPKGVLLEHRSVINTLSALDGLYPFEESDVYLLKTSYTFDVSVTELFGWFPGGGRLALLEKHGEKDPYEILTAIETFGVTHINFVPSMFNVFVNTLDQVNIGKLSSLKYIFLAGEALLPDPVKKFRELNPEIVLENLYGPTEAAIYASRYSLSNWDSRINIPIGKPLPNVELYVLDMYGHLQPIGVAGELCISGVGVARGYLNRPTLTAERFCLRRPGGRFLKKLPPWTPRKNFSLRGSGSRYYRSHRSYTSYISCLSYLYRTGDLAKWLPDGDIEFLGRMDQQVKVRGFRIEPGEIENRLLEIDYVKEAVVIARQDNTGEKYLCAYVVGKDIDAPRLRDILSGVLPSYMVPSYVVPLEKVPFTPSGKVNRNALPEPVVGGKGEKYAAPAAGTEVKLVELWSRVLGMEKENISIDANFFDLGGNSLKAAQLTAHIHQTFQVQLSLGEIFKTPTIRGEALTINKTGKTTFLDIETVEQKEFYELSYHQRRLWIISRLESDTVAYNMPERIKLTHKVDESAFKKVIYKILERHESLRTGFKTINKKPVQFVAAPDKVGIPLKHLDLSAWEENDRQKHLEQIFAREAKTPFDLTHPPLLRFLLVKMTEEKFWMVFNMHHIITDGFSQEILKNEFMCLYERYRKDEPTELEPLALQYKDFAAWQNKQMKNPEIKTQSHRFWKQILEKRLPPVALPVDSNLHSDSKEGAEYLCVIPGKIKDRLNQLAKSKNTSLFIVMLSLFNVFLSRISGQESIRMGLPVSGRDHVSLQNIVGFFVNTVILDTDVDNDLSFAQFLEQVNANVLEVLQHQAYPLEVVLDDLNMKFPGVNVFFNMLNLSTGTLEKEMDSMESYHTDEVIDVKFDLMIYISEYKNGIQLNCNYRKAMFKPSTISSNMERYLKIIDFFTANPEKGIREFKRASGQHKKRSLKRN
jgi:amino acid adenylation domain-containing protein